MRLLATYRENVVPDPSKILLENSFFNSLSVFSVFRTVGGELGERTLKI